MMYNFAMAPIVIRGTTSNCPNAALIKGTLFLVIPCVLIGCRFLIVLSLIGGRISNVPNAGSEYLQCFNAALKLEVQFNVALIF